MLRSYTFLMRRSVSLFSHSRSSSKRDGSDKERLMKEKLRSHFPRATNIDVVDISGGCGAMYEVAVTSPDFKGLNVVKQHRLVNEALKEELREMHGVRIHTSIS